MRLLFIIVLGFLFGVSYSQENLQLIGEVEAEGQFFTTDRLGNFYVANGPLLKRFNRDGQAGADFRSSFPGNISQIDASDPLHILLFYKDFNQAVFLDRNLTEKSRPFVFSEYGIEYAELVCASSRGGVWILDWMKRELVFLNSDLRLVFRKPLPVGVVHANHPPAFMTEDEGNLYVSFPGTGILRFDLMGNYISLNTVKVEGAFQVNRNTLIFPQGNLVKLYSLNSPDTGNIDTGIKEKISFARREGNQLTIFTGQKIFIFTIIYVVVY